MKDQYGREIEYLRVSVTDRCNLRCTYCMPPEGVEQVAHGDILTYDEIVRICTVCAGLGISKVKLTGGEPLVRKGLDSLLRRIKTIDGIKEVTLTTNGVLLADQIKVLSQAGLDAVNISLDTLDKSMYEQMTRRDELERALAGLKAALCHPHIRVKVNCVILAGTNDSQWVPIAGLAKDKHVDVRFIEMMPIGLGKVYHGGGQEQVCERLKLMYGEPDFLEGRFGNGPAVYARFPQFTGKIGFISAVSHQFCESCNRIRLTSEGYLKPCLQYSSGADVKAVIRSGGDDSALAEIMRKQIFEKPASHQFTENSSSDEKADLEERKMSSIGG